MVMVFNIDNYKGHFAMHCATAREAKEFCDYLDSLGKTWKSRETYAMVTNWSIFKSRTCYLFNEGVISDLSYCKRDGYSVLEWSDFITKFTKGDLRDGMVVESLKAKRYQVLGDRLVGSNSYMLLSDLTKDLKDLSSPDDTIIKVYKSNARTLSEILNIDYLTLIWEREERQEPIEMTLEEVCRELGKEIKIVKSK